MPPNPNLDDLSFLEEIPDLPGAVHDHESSAPAAVGSVRVGPAASAAQPPALAANVPSRGQIRRRWKHALALGAGWMAAHLVAYGVREDLSALPLSYVLVQIAAPLLIGIISLVMALSPGRLGLGAALGVTATLALVGPLSFGLAAFGVPPPLPVTQGSWVSHCVCLDLTLVWMSVPLLLFAFHLRGAFAAGAGLRSALVGGACGLFAGAMMNLHCSSVEQIHMVLGHAVPVGIGCLVGGLVASRWLKT